MPHTTPVTVRSLTAVLVAAACVLSAGSASATTKKAKPAHAAQPAQPAPLADLSEEQLANAERVLTGAQACEFNQTIAVEGAPEKAGYFHIVFKGKKYLLAPEPTTTGAVRLEDKKAGVVWLQIANKSMLMNAKIGQRMVDECIHPSQKV
ncbi:hypothetical protein [Sphaerotilus sp.]|uniref:hypothetical protein n=1 Tax=Sphaerotilus sp. TaxID=2093942 RepID=UPI0025DE9576|nr:hypothetical protein [Sphaerotilus sp.]